ncbi:MAG: ribonuclease R [Alteromonadaceae bacterium]|nr:ribonuclease R [Alteromonadaceae bacterium]
MSKKDPHFQREAKKYDNPVASREHILALFQRLQTPLNFKQVCQEFGYQSDDQLIGIKRRLRAMENAGQLIFNKFKQYALPNKANVLTGKVIGHRDGYGFFVLDADENGKRGKDLFISSFEMQRVFHGDIVSAMASDSKDRKGRKEVRILEIIETRKAPIVGRFFINKREKTAIVVPDDARINQEIIIDLADKSNKNTARHGQIVAVEITQRPSKRRNAVGKIVEVLGDYMAPGMEIEIALREHDLPHKFSAEVLAEVGKIADEVEEKSKSERVDLRDLPLVTIDGEDARDFDDAVYCQPKKSGGWRLWVAIADVSYYVRPDTALDNEAILRGNSVYFPSQVIPMLPEKLSNGLCSLNPDVDRLCFVCEMTVSAAGKLSGSKFYPAVMRSHARFTYTKVAAILDSENSESVLLRQQYAPLVPDLENLEQMYQALVTARKQRGAIEFETQETRFIFNEQRKISGIEAVTRNDAHKIIEECMILANVATAKFVEKHKVPALFRVHDKPSSDKFANFVSYLAELGVDVSNIDKEDPQPKDYGEILKKVADRPDQELIQTMLLRSMRQAVYQAENLGHFGLALAQYSHFTSPIRRYPDLIVHRIIKAILESQQNDQANIGCYSYPPAAVIELGEHCSLTERRADEATRDVADWLKCEFMQDHVGDTFTGVISTVTNFGMFVRLQELHIEGLIHISSLGQDYYQYDEKRLRLVGENTGVKYHVGDLLSVKVAAVNLDEKKIDLVLAGEKALLKKAKRIKPSAEHDLSQQENKTDKKTKKRKSKPDKPAKEKTIKSKVKKRSERKKRPGKNARKKVKE